MYRNRIISDLITYLLLWSFASLGPLKPSLGHLMKDVWRVKARTLRPAFMGGGVRVSIEDNT